MEEIWKPVAGFEGLYEVSNLGRVYSIPRIDGGNVKRGGHLMSYTSDKGGYLRCKLTKNGKRKIMFVHRLVAMAFIPNPKNFPCINHKDENTANNVVTNLEWCDYSYNINYGNRKEKVRAKELNGVRSKPVAQYNLDGTLIQVYPSLNEAARQTGLSLGNLNCCCLNKPHYKTCGGYIWKYAF